MASTTPDDQLLVILLRNLHNAASTFGEGSKPHESIRRTVEDHLLEMRGRDVTTTTVTEARAEGGALESQRKSDSQGQSTKQQQQQQQQQQPTFENLAFRPKPSTG